MHSEGRNYGVLGVEMFGKGFGVEDVAAYPLEIGVVDFGGFLDVAGHCFDLVLFGEEFFY